MTLPLFAVAQSSAAINPFVKKPYDGFKGQPDSIAKTIYFYNEDKGEIEPEPYSNSVYRTKFDNKGNVVSKDGSSGPPKMRKYMNEVYTYNEKGDILKQLSYENDQLQSEFILKQAGDSLYLYEQIEYKGYANGRAESSIMNFTKLSDTNFRLEQPYFQVDYYYSEKGQLKELIVYTENNESGVRTQIGTCLVEYDEGGWVVQETLESEEEDEIIVKTIEYTKFDEYGNWLECIVKSTEPKVYTYKYVQEIYYRK